MTDIHYTLDITKEVESGLDATIVVTCHNYGSYLAQCLSSLLSQNKKAKRIILMDDASSDETPEIALSFPEVEYVRVEYRDVCAARDHALRTVTTPWVLFVDADNWLQFRYLEFLYQKALSCDRNVCAVYASKKVFGRYDDVFTADPYEEDRLDTESFMDMCALIRVAALREIGGWNGPMRDARGPCHDDWGVWLRFRAQGWTFVPCPNALLMYRAHDSNYSALGGMQSPNTIIRHARFTLLTVLSGRHWNLSRYLKWLARMDCVPSQVELMLLDNSGDKEFGEQLRVYLALQDRFSSYQYLKIDRKCDPSSVLSNADYAEGGVKERLVRDAAIHTHVAALYAEAFSRIKGDYVWVVEDDVIPDDDALIHLIEALAWKRRAGCVGARVVSRLHEGKLIAGPHVDDSVSVQEVEFTSAGCTLYRTRALKHVRPRYERTDKETLFWDVALGRDLREEGWKVLLNTSVHTQHYNPDGTFV